MLRKSQTILEYSLVIAVIVTAFLGMQVYMSRGLKGNFHSAGARLSDQYDYGRTKVKTRVSSSSSSVTLNTPGIGHAMQITWGKGKTTAESMRALTVLEESKK